MIEQSLSFFLVHVNGFLSTWHVSHSVLSYLVPVGCFCSYTLEEIAEGAAMFLISGHLASILGDFV